MCTILFFLNKQYISVTYPIYLLNLILNNVPTASCNFNITCLQSVRLYRILCHMKSALTIVFIDFGTKSRIKWNISFQNQITEFCDLCGQPDDFHAVFLYGAILSYHLDLYSV